MVLVSKVALLTADLLLPARIFKFGFLADFLSRAVLVGFLTGVGLQVGIPMLGDMLGISTNAGNTILLGKHLLPGYRSRWWLTLAPSRRAQRSPSQHTASLSSARCLTATRARPPP